MCNIQNDSGLYTIIGVLIGYLLAEGTRIIHKILRIRKMKRIIRKELISIKNQIIDKCDIVHKVISTLNNEKLLPASSVGTINTGYKQFYSYIYEHLSNNERNCLFYIHETLSVGEQILNNFENDFQLAITRGTFENPYEAFKAKFSDLLGAYDNVTKYIESYLKGKPINVLPENEK